MRKSGISVDIAKKNLIYRTSVLEPYKGGLMFKIQKSIPGDGIRNIYQVESVHAKVIFKQNSCSNSDIKAVEQLKNEFNLSIEAYQAARDGVVLPISFEEFVNQQTDEYSVEMVYEYGGDDILTALKDANGLEIMDAMGTVAKIMLRLEDKHIFHNNINPKNIAISNGVIKLLDFGVTRELNENNTLTLKTEEFNSAMIYLPPEFSDSNKRIPAAVDAYSWGIVLYQLLTGRTEKELVEDIQSYGAFLDNVRNLKVKGDPDRSITKKAVSILVKVLDLNPRRRPNFRQIVSMISTEESYNDKLEKTNRELLEVAKERDEFKARFERLFAEHNKCPGMQKNFRAMEEEIKKLKVSPISLEKVIIYVN